MGHRFLGLGGTWPWISSIEVKLRECSLLHYYICAQYTNTYNSSWDLRQQTRYVTVQLNLNSKLVESDQPRKHACLYKKWLQERIYRGGE